MAQKKTNTERIKDNAERISDNADRISELEAQVAALIGDAGKPSEKPKPTKKSATTKKPAAKKTAAKSAAAKKPATKKPATKKPAVKKEPVAEEEHAAPIDDEMAKAIAEAEAFAAAQNEPKAEEPAPEPEKQELVQAEAAATQEAVEEPTAEEPKEKDPASEAAAVQEPQETEKPAEKSGGSFAAKTDAALKSKKAKLPIFITINSLFLISAILLMFTSFAFGVKGVETHNYNIFQYYANADIVKAHLDGQALGWGDGAYVMLGILMFLAMLVPLALMIKNIIIFARKKDASVYNADALIYFATMLFFISMVNMFGAWLSAGQVICLIISAVILAFTLLTMLITKSVKQLPFFSIINIVIVFMSLFMLTWKVYDVGDYAWSPAAAADEATGGGFMFFMLLLAVIALVALVVLQMKRFPGAVGHIIEIVVPLVAAVCALIAIICAGAALPESLNVSGAFIVGVLFTILLAVADTLFTFVKPLKKYRVLVDDSNDGYGNNVFADATPIASENVTTEPAVEEKPVEEKAEEDPEAVFCTECGTKNAPDCSFCTKCGTKLIK